MQDHLPQWGYALVSVTSTPTYGQIVKEISGLQQRRSSQTSNVQSAGGQSAPMTGCHLRMAKHMEELGTARFQLQLLPSPAGPR